MDFVKGEWLKRDYVDLASVWDFVQKQKSGFDGPELREHLPESLCSAVDALVETQIGWARDELGVRLSNPILPKEKIFVYNKDEWKKPSLFTCRRHAVNPL